MKLTLKEKAKLFWDRNKKDIIGWLIGAGVITGVGCAAAYARQKASEKEEAKRLEEANKRAEEKERQRIEAEIEQAKIENDPANQLSCGGYVDPANDNLYEPDWPNLLANKVPLSAMGEFGEEVIRKLTDNYPDYEETGPFDPNTAIADVYVDFGHQIYLEAEKWKESQEKQAS
jgi:hypothetical protein